MIRPLDVIAPALAFTGFVLIVYGNATGFLIGFAMVAAGVGLAMFFKEEE